MAVAAVAQFGPQRIIEGAETEGPFIVLTADLDADGDLDVISGSQEDDRIAWYPNDGSGQFGPQHVIATALPRLEGMCLADLDQDGDADIVFCTWEDDRVSWSENAGSGDFLPPATIGIVDGHPYGVCTGDLDGDGTLDVLALEFGAIHWYPHNGSGTFGAAHIIDVGGNYGQRDLACADPDADGDTDVLAAREEQGIAVFANDGTGVFGPRTLLDPGPHSARSVRSGDLNGDGVPDVYGSPFSLGRFIVWYEGLGSGQFAPRQRLEGPGDDFIVAADVDGDGDLDLVSADTETGTVLWCANDGTGVFSAQHTVTRTAYWCKYVHAADLDGDGDLDLLSASFADDKIAWYMNDGAGSFGPQRMITEAASDAVHVLGVDVDGDGDRDVIAASFSDYKLAWYPNDGAGNFGTVHRTSILIYHPEVMCSGDLDGDGDPDLVVGTWDDQLLLFANDGLGNFSGPDTIVPALPGPEALDVADLDGDGDLDLLATAEDQSILWYANDGAGGFTAHVIASVTWTGGLRAVDMDRDGDIDVLYYRTDKVAWKANNGAGMFGPEQVISVGSPNTPSYDLFAADMDGDNDLDVVFTRGDEVLLCMNEAFTFTVQTIDPDIDFGHRVRPLDMDLDGDLDIVAAAFYGDQLRTYENLGAGVFGAPQVLADSVNTPRWVDVADLDGDGDEDVLSASSSDNKIAWYENLYLATALAPRPVVAPFTVAPNPMGNGARLIAPRALTGTDHAEVIDAQGRIVRTLRGNGTSTIIVERNGLPAGSYVVRLLAGGRSVGSLVLVVE